MKKKHVCVGILKIWNLEGNREEMWEECFLYVCGRMCGRMYMYVLVCEECVEGGKRKRERERERKKNWV